MWLAAHPNKERYDEDDARAFFDEHGRWPDEPEHGRPADLLSCRAERGA